MDHETQIEYDTRTNSYTSDAIVDGLFKYKKRRDILAKFGMEFLAEFCENQNRTVKREHMVDVGCGSGIQTVEFKQHFIRITGVDISNAQIAKAKESFPDVTNVEFQYGTGEKIPVDGESADVITSVYAVQDFDFENFKKECNRVLKPDGLVMLITSWPHKITPIGNCCQIGDEKDEKTTCLWNRARSEFTKRAAEIEHPEWHVFNEYQYLYSQNFNDFIHSRCDEKEYEMDMSLREMRESFYSIPFHRLSEPKKTLEDYFLDLKRQCIVENVSDDDITLRHTNRVSVVIFSKRGNVELNASKS